MNFKAHAIGAGLAAVSTASFWYFEARIPWELALISIPATFIGGLFPDVDIDSSIPSRWYARISLVLAIALLAGGIYLKNMDLHILAILIALLFFFCKSFVHRGFIHSFTIPIGLIIGAFTIPTNNDLVPVIMSSFGAGILVHLFLDYSKTLYLKVRRT
jgi:hypothetical protein